MATLRFTQKFEGELVSVYDMANGGGWSSREEFQAARFRHYDPTVSHFKRERTSLGIRETVLTGMNAGTVFDVEFIAS